MSGSVGGVFWDSMCVCGEVVYKPTFNDKRVDDKIQHQNDDSDGRHHQTCGKNEKEGI